MNSGGSPAGSALSSRLLIALGVAAFLSLLLLRQSLLVEPPPPALPPRVNVVPSVPGPQVAIPVAPSVPAPPPPAPPPATSTTPRSPATARAALHALVTSLNADAKFTLVPKKPGNGGCATRPQRDCDGNDLEGVAEVKNVPSVGECCALCTANPACMVAVLATDGQSTCLLKSGCPNPSVNSARTFIDVGRVEPPRAVLEGPPQLLASLAPPAGGGGARPVHVLLIGDSIDRYIVEGACTSSDAPKRSWGFPHGLKFFYPLDVKLPNNDPEQDEGTRICTLPSGDTIGMLHLFGAGPGPYAKGQEPSRVDDEDPSKRYITDTATRLAVGLVAHAAFIRANATLIVYQTSIWDMFAAHDSFHEPMTRPELDVYAARTIANYGVLQRWVGGTGGGA